MSANDSASKSDLKPVRYTSRERAAVMPRECPVKAKVVEKLMKEKK